MALFKYQISIISSLPPLIKLTIYIIVVCVLSLHKFISISKESKRANGGVYISYKLLAFFKKKKNLEINGGISISFQCESGSIKDKEDEENFVIFSVENFSPSKNFLINLFINSI